MSDKRVWVTVSRGISPEISDTIFSREVDANLAREEPVLVAGLKRALLCHLHSRGIIPLETED